MKRLIPALGIALAGMSLVNPVALADDYVTVGGVERFQPAMDELVAGDAVVERLTGELFQWSEGPVWVPDGQYVIFSDVPKNTAWKWSEVNGLEEFLRPSAFQGSAEENLSSPGTNGLMLSLEGKLLACDHGSRSVFELDLATMEQKQLAGHYQGRRLNSPNDLALSRVRWPGTLFFTDPPYGLKGQDDSLLKELDFNGIYRLDPDGTVTLLDDSMGRPNGIVLSLDEKTLYVANSQSSRTVWMAFELDENGNINGEGRLFADAQAQADNGMKGLPDGMAVDVEGNLWATGPGGVYVIAPDGTMLGRIETGTAIANCAFGGEDGSVLYMTSHSFLARIQTLTRGVEFQ